MKKRILSILLMSAMVLNMSGCLIAEKIPINTTATTTATTTTTTTTAATTTTTAVETESVPDETDNEVQRLIDLINNNASTTAKPATTTTTTTTAATTTTTTVETESVPDETDDEVQRLIGLIGNNTSTTTTTAKPAETTKPIETNAISNKLADIKKICGLKSDVETNIKICAVDVFDTHNPYDVVYDYGTAYNAYVDVCDWNLVFDADYYIEQFPMLATLYHNDKTLLLEHFQTVGIHEGRQGSADFNVGAYKANCDSDIRNAFDNNYEGYYFYYMLNHKTEKSVKTTSSKYEIQYKQIMTKCQADELAGVNMYRDEVNVADIAFDSELAAFANYRAWTNAHDGWRGHKWTYESENYNFIVDYVTSRNANGMGENTSYYLNSCRPYGETSYAGYRNSTAHYEAMINAKNDLIGLSNVYYSWSDTFTNHFQTFLDF